MRIALQASLAFLVSMFGTRSPLNVDYTLTVASPDATEITVDMLIHYAPPAFRVAMVAHTEYDDEYWRYVTDLRGESARGAVQVTRDDSSAWHVTAPPGDVMLHYRVRFPASPPMQQAAWKAHLTTVGGLVGGPHSFLYVVGTERAPVRLTVKLPATWKIATGLDSTSDAHTFAAAGIEALVDSPILVGLFRNWRFAIDGVPHEVAYLGHPGGTTFDTTRFVASVERIARESARMFGSMPYRHFHFLFEDGTFGGLEHLNSVSLGAQSRDLARDPDGYLGQTAHEFFHIWNEVHIRPLSWIGVRHAAPEPTGELWWSEGVTLYYADLLLRRAALPTTDSTRVAHLERMIGIYLANPSHGLVSPEQTSRAFNMPPSATGDYTPSMYTQGEMIGTLLDLKIRESTNGRRSLDDAMRAMSEKFSPERGFSGADVERATADACGCDMKPFFDAYVRGAAPLDLDRALAAFGLRAAVRWSPALASDGTPAADARFSAYSVPGDSAVRLKIWFPSTVWGRAGLHTGDRIGAFNGAPIHTTQAFREAASRLRVGDTVRLSLTRGSITFDKTIVVPGYDRPSVRLETRSDATDAQRHLFDQWKAAK